jgi:hypothetical protein
MHKEKKKKASYTENVGSNRHTHTHTHTQTEREREREREGEGGREAIQQEKEESNHTLVLEPTTPHTHTREETGKSRRPCFLSFVLSFSFLRPSRFTSY